MVAEYRTANVRQVVIRPDAAHSMVTALKNVVTRDGTAAKAALEKLYGGWQDRHGAKAFERTLCRRKLHFLIIGRFSGG